MKPGFREARLSSSDLYSWVIYLLREYLACSYLISSCDLISSHTLSREGLRKYFNVKSLKAPRGHCSYGRREVFQLLNVFPLAGKLTQCHTMMPICHPRVICTNERQTNDLTTCIWRNKVFPKLNTPTFFVLLQRIEVTALAETSFQF